MGTCFSREDRNELLIENVCFGFCVPVSDVIRLDALVLQCFGTVGWAAGRASGV